MESTRTPSQASPQRVFMGRIRPESHVVWYETYGRFPRPGRFLCHVCDNRRCINVEHLFEGTPADNTRDMIEKGRQHEMQKTHCPSGHPYDEANTYRRPSRPNQRQCRICLDRSARAAAKRARERRVSP